MSVQAQIVRRFEEYVLAEKGLAGQGSINFEHAGVAARGYPYVRSGHAPFEEGLVQCLELLDRPAEKVRFLEVGCGIGTKCGIAHFYGVQVAGFDLHEGYLTVAREIFPELAFEHANALQFDYREYDLIFYHVPLADDDLMVELEDRVLRHMPTSSILLNTKITSRLRNSLLDDNGVAADWQSTFRFPDVNAGRLVTIQKIGPIEEGTPLHA